MIGDAIGLLEGLLEATQGLLALSEPSAEAWESYRQKRETIFAELAGTPFPTEGAGRAKAKRLIEDVLACEAPLAAKIGAQRRLLQREMTAAHRSHQAVKSYGAGPSSSLFLERSI